MLVAPKPRGRSWAWKALCAAFLAPAIGCSATSSVTPATDASGPPVPGGDGGIDTADASPSPHDAGVSADASASDASVADAGPDSSFNASGLTVVATPTTDGGSVDSGGAEDAGPGMCVLTSDGRYLLVTIANEAANAIGPTTVLVATNGTTFQTGLPTPSLAPGATSTLEFDRGPLVGFVADWQFTITIDPTGAHGGPFGSVVGGCTDLRSRATAGMVPLPTWYDTDSGLWDGTDWWTSANQLETVIDYSRETGDPTYTGEINNTFTLNDSNNFDKYGYYDDDGWWALAWIKAYDLSHQEQYLDMAKTIFTRMTGGWDTKCNGGLYWASAEAGSNGLANKNAIPNELFLTVAARLHQRTPGDTSYLAWAQKEWTWFSASGMITADNQIVDGLADLTTCAAAGPIFTYNQGVILGGLADLAASTGDATLLTQASAIALATMEKMSNANGVLVETPCGGNICDQFKGIFMRNLAYLYKALPLPELQAYMKRQSDNLWTTSVRNADNEFDYAWEAPFAGATASRQSSALDALIAAVRSENMNLAIGATASGPANCGATETPSMAVDGSSGWDSKWCAGGAGGQALTVDLGSPGYVVGFRVRHAGAGGENSAWDTRDFEILTSDDGTTWTTVVTVTGNTDDVTTHPIPAVTARYAQLHITTAQTATDALAARIYEFEIDGIAW
jgi:predicted alpha-1,6-mannanase (GH76 family)